MNTQTHDRISPTAKFVAYLRALSGIRYTEEISRLCGAEEVFRSLSGEHPEDFLWPATTIEMRYKSVDALIDQYPYPNILEIDAGVSPRGFIRSAADPKTTYIETNPPGMVIEKGKIAFECDCNKRENWYLFSANAITVSELQDAISASTGPLTIINEGLLPYLGFKEKALVARGIHKILKKRGGVWITPSLSTNDRYKHLVATDPKFGKALKAISDLTGRKMQTNSFDNVAAAERFFGDIGFKLTRHKQCDLVPRLSSLGKTNIDPAKLDVVLERGLIWVLTVKPQQ